MRRSEVRVALGLSVVLGVIIGAVLHNQLGPITSAGGSPPPSPGTSRSATPTPSAQPSSPTPTASSAPASSAPPSSAPESPDPSEEDGPPFTHDALLNADHLIEHGWESAGPVDDWDGVPPEQITACAHLASDDVVEAYAAKLDGTAEGDQPIASAEVVMRFADVETAEGALAELVRQVNACESAPPGESTLEPTRLDPPDPDDKVDEAVVWSAEGENGQVLAAIGVARADDRVALLSLSAFGKDGAEPVDPLGTTDFFELTVYAGRRLV